MLDKDNFSSHEIAEQDISEVVDDITFQHEQQNDDTEAADINYNINCYGGDYDVDSLVRRFEQKEIYWPDFQKNYVWTHQQASQFIDSILVGLPIPSLFLFKEVKTKKFLIIDGLQRLTTLQAFKAGKYPNSEKTFHLSGVPKGRAYYNKTYNMLDDREHGIFNDTFLHILFVQQTVPDADHSAAFHIFERINSGSSPLKSQEIRKAIYYGEFQKTLVEMNDYEIWRNIFGIKHHSRTKDQELILRFLALCNWEKEYRHPMKLFLNRFMNKFKNAEQDQLDIFKNQFHDTLKRIYSALGNRAFRIGNYGAFSAPYFDSFMVSVAGDENTSCKSIKLAYEQIQNNEEFSSLIKATSTNEKIVRRRIAIVREALNIAS